MAKKQTFGDKLSKNSDHSKKNTIKLIRSYISEETGSVRFSEDLLAVPDGQTPENIIKEFIKLK